MNPTLSIIVPSYNSIRTIRDCIISILHQSFQDYELIVIDDGSTDESGELLDRMSLSDGRLKIVHINNSGVAVARNTGINISIGRYITFIDSDDIILPGYLDNFKYTDEYDFQLQGVTVNYIGRECDNITITPTSTKECSIKDLIEEAEMRNLLKGPVVKLFRNSIIKMHDVKFPVGINYGEDAIMVKEYLLAASGKAYMISDSKYLYNHYPNSNSLTNINHYYIDLYKSTVRAYELFRLLDHKLGGFNRKVYDYYLKNSALEMYDQITSAVIAKDNNTERFIESVRTGLFNRLYNVTDLPITYKLLRTILLPPPTRKRLGKGKLSLYRLIVIISNKLHNRG